MLSNLLDNPKLFRHVAEDLPVGIFIVDHEGLIRFWNHGAEHFTGHLAHDVVGHVFEDVVRACDRSGNTLMGERCPVTATLNGRRPQACPAFFLHKSGHRLAVTVRTLPILEYGDAIGGATVLFEETSSYREEWPGLAVYGCLDAITGIPSRRLTKAVLNECIAGVDESHIGFGLLRIRVLGLQEFRSKHGPPSVAPFLRSAAHTLRHTLAIEDFLGCWEENEFLAVLASASPVTVATTAETMWNLLSHSEILWWGDRFLVESEVASTVVTTGKVLESVLSEMKPSHSSATARAAAAGSANGSTGRRG